ncbi:MAG: DUF1439 domain-containing protein [Pseudomonadota bacterium]|nr:DUF1439 domain-containing protein [Pseudomonadota bacterium]
MNCIPVQTPRARRLSPFTARVLLACLVSCGVLPARETFAAQPEIDGGPGQDVSTVEVPVTLDLAPLFSYMESRVPRRMGTGQTWQNYRGADLQYDIWRGPVQASMAGNRLRASIPLGYRVRARKSVAKLFKVKGSCGVDEAPRVVYVSMESNLAWGKDWNLLSRTRVYPNRFANPCLMTFANIDVTPMIDRQLGRRLVRIARQTIDEQVPALTDIGALAREAWSSLQAPVALDDGIWLLVRPESVSVGPLNGRGAILETSVGVTARPEIVFGGVPDTDPLPLPPLRVTQHPKSGFHIEAETAIRRDELRTLLESRLSKVMQRFGGESVRLESVEVDATGDVMGLTIHATSPLAISVRLQGTPAYDRENGEIYLKDAALENVTGGDAANLVERWIVEGLGGQLERQARWPVSAPFRTALDRLGDRIDSELPGGVAIDVQIEDIRFHDLRSTPERLNLAATLEGTARLAIGGAVAQARGRQTAD